MCKVREANFFNGEDANQKGIYIYYCPGCRSHHVVHTLSKNRCNAQWGFNGNLSRPTFTPSVKSTAGAKVCHHYVTNGQIHFLQDCTHELAGQVVDMNNIDW